MNLNEKTDEILKKKKRMILTKEEKEMLLHKSNYRCSHCGKKLTLETVTCDHVIPISKGSNSDYKNMVALCNDCNQKKSDTILIESLGFYYKFLNRNYLKQTIHYADQYIKETNWITYKNFLPSDITYFTERGRVRNEDFLSEKQEFRFLPKYILKHADYSDLDRLLDFWCQRYRQFRNTPNYMSREVLKEALEINFMTSGIYIIIGGASKEIVGTYTVCFNESRSYKNNTVVEISSIACGNKHISLMANVIYEQIVSIQNNLGVTAGIIEIVVAKTESGAMAAMDYISTLVDCGYGRTAESKRAILFTSRFTKVSSLSHQKSNNGLLRRASKACEKHLLKRNEDLKKLLPKDKYNTLMNVLWFGEISKKDK